MVVLLHLANNQTRTLPKSRIESLSDLIFGLALSIGAINLVSNVSNITTKGMLLNDIAVFGFSFLILISVWMRYTRTMTFFPFENRLSVSLNTALLFTVSLEPFLFNVLEMNRMLAEDFESQVYAIDLGIMMIILASFTLVLADEDRKLIPADMIREAKAESITMFVAGGLFLISLLEIFWVRGPYGFYLRYYLWMIPFVLAAVRRRTSSIMNFTRKSKQQKKSVDDLPQKE